MGNLFLLVAACFCGASISSTPNIVLTHSTTKIFPDKPFSIEKAYTTPAAAKNEYEPVQVVLNGPLTQANIQLTVDNPLRAAIYVVGYLDIRNVSDCNSTGIRATPDPLIPDVDVFYQEQRNALPINVPDGENRVVWLDFFVPPEAHPGKYSVSVKVKSTSYKELEANFDFEVWNFTLPSTSSLGSIYGLQVSDLPEGHQWPKNYPRTELVDLSLNYVMSGLMHRVTLAEVPEQLSDNFDAEWISTWGKYMNGADTPFGLKGAGFTALKLREADGVNWLDPEPARRQKTVNFWKKFYNNMTAHNPKWSQKLFDYTIDEPTSHCNATIKPICQHHMDEIKNRATALHEASRNLRTLVTTEKCTIRGLSHGICHEEPNQKAIDEYIDLWVPMIQYMAGREEPPPGGQDCGSHVPKYNQRSTYANITKNNVWWYEACFSEGGCNAGCDPGSSFTQCLQGWPSMMIDHPAVRMRVWQWAAFLYDVAGELYWSTNGAYRHQIVPGQTNASDPWITQLVAGGNGEGNLFYPGRPNKIGGKHDIPVPSIRLKLTREGHEDFEYFTLLANKKGNKVALKYLEKVMTAATAYSMDPLKLLGVRKEIAAMLEM